jgi:hypothetical protein
MLRMVRGVFGLALSVALLLAMVAPGVAQEAPSGKVAITSRGFAVLFGVNWGDGVLTMPDGSTHKFSVENVKVLSVGGSVVDAEGEVYNLKQVRDLEGNYSAAEAGFAIIGGLDGVTMKNEHGVVINLRATQLGLSLTLGGGSMAIKLKSHLY